MSSILRVLTALWITGTAISTWSLALTVPFTEDFTNSAENWLSGSFGALTHVATGGPDGDAFVSGEGAFVNRPPQADAIVAFRGELDFGASGGEFAGQWISNGVGEVSAYFRHFGPEPLQAFVRVATSGNFPGATIQRPAAVPPGEWTLLAFDVRPDNPLLTIEGPFPFGSVFNNVGNLQFGVEVPQHLLNDTTLYRFDLDRVTIRVPEPAGAALALGALALPWVCIRRRSR